MMEARKQGLLQIFPLLITICFLSSSAYTQYGGGAGEPNDPYLIYTAEQMNQIGLNKEDWDGHFKLMADIDLSSFTGRDFNIIGIDREEAFSGVFNGNSKIIYNFNYTSTDKDRIGLFGYAGKRAEIRDLGQIDPNIINADSGHGVGSLAGENYGTITNCYVKGGSVWGYWDVGGLVGSNSGTIIDCYFAGNVSGSNGVGGLAGVNYEGTISNCSSSGNVSGGRFVGGLVGDNPAYDVVSTIINCYSSSDVSGGDYVGGLAGASGWSYPGNHFTVIRNCYSVGEVFGNETVGGFVGDNIYETGSIISSFWDIQTSGQSSSDGGTGKTTDEMQMESTFTDAGWDFGGETDNGTEDTWWILEGQSYPRLWWQYGLAFSPYPQDGAIEVIQPVILNWLPGGLDFNYDVYFGEDEELVAGATKGSPEYKVSRDSVWGGYNPGKLSLDTTYYWRIDEVNDNTNSSWKGDVWSFTTADFIILDDFESYNNLCQERCKRLWDVWVDGWDIQTNGSIVGYEYPPFRERIIVHGGFWSMPFFYDNSGPANISEATMTLTDLRDWTEEGVGILSLWFHGDPNNVPEPMYLALNGIAHVDNDNPNVAQEAHWTEWRIELQEFAGQGVDLTNINSISIGFGDKNNPQSGGSGLVFFDDIRLYRPAPQ